jgi:hypothetical protein
MGVHTRAVVYVEQVSLMIFPVARRLGHIHGVHTFRDSRIDFRTKQVFCFTTNRE